ncbi:MAG: hypothetical protein OXS30_06070 [Chloroflexota bacterium]|nr:hypothetical protein [Chloroflexota bacterium]
MRQVKLIGSLVQDERQLDGSRHVEIAADADDIDLALRLVVDRDGSLQEADLSLDMDGASLVIGFDGIAEIGDEEELSLRLRGAEGEAEVLQRDDGEIALAVTLFDPVEASE